jgi:hypothetical protein
MDPWIQIRIHPKMSWIRKSEKLIVCEFFLINDVAADSGFVSVADSGLNSLHPSPPVHDPNLKYFKFLFFIFSGRHQTSVSKRGWQLRGLQAHEIAGPASEEAEIVENF